MIGRDPKPGADRQIDRVVWIKLNHPMFLIRLTNNGVAVAPGAVEVQCEPVTEIMRRRLGAAILRQRQTAGIHQDTARPPSDDAGQHRNGDAVRPMGLDLRLKQITEHVDPRADFRHAGEVLRMTRRWGTAGGDNADFVTNVPQSFRRARNGSAFRLGDARVLPHAASGVGMPGRRHDAGQA